MPSRVHVLVSLQFLTLLAAPVFDQGPDLCELKDTATPCLKFRPQPEGNTDPIDLTDPHPRTSTVEDFFISRSII